jgi:hypothetical protein
VKREGGLNHVIVQEFRDAAVPESNAMVFRLIEPGILELVDSGVARSVGLDAIERLMFDTLSGLVREADGQPVKLADWRAALDKIEPDPMAANPPLSPEARRSKWRRLEQGLDKAGSVKIMNGKAIPISPFKDDSADDIDGVEA